MPVVGQADLTKLIEMMQKAAGGAQLTTQQVLVDAATYIKGDMESRVPVRTGRLRQSISIQILQDRIVIGPHTEYAAYVEFGTKPHVIRAKNKKALAFYSGGKRVIVKEVHHPGTRAQPYVRPAYQDWVDEIASQVAEANVKELLTP